MPPVEWILLVEDEADHRILVREALDRVQSGLLVYEVANGAEAIGWMRRRVANGEPMEGGDTNTEQHVLQEGCLLILHRAWLAPSAADDLMLSMQREVDWQQRAINLFGKQLPQPRLIGWAATTSYTYSGLTLPPKPATDT